MTRKTHLNVNLRIATLIAGVSMLFVACSSSTTSSGSTASTSASASTSTEPTPDTSAATTSTSTSTTVPAPIVFTLRSDGIGPFDLGVAADELIDAITAQFGPADFDYSEEYPFDDGFGRFQTAEGEFEFSFPFGRSACWSFEFCAEFGGADAVTQAFVGWTYGEDSGLTLASTSGVTIGSRWSDFPDMNVHSGGCYTVGSGEIDGIALTVQSDDVSFGTFDDDGNYIEAIPPADEVAVAFMQTGEIPVHLLGDC